MTQNEHEWKAACVCIIMKTKVKKVIIITASKNITSERKKITTENSKRHQRRTEHYETGQIVQKINYVLCDEVNQQNECLKITIHSNNFVVSTGAAHGLLNRSVGPIIIILMISKYFICRYNITPLSWLHLTFNFFVIFSSL